jgi:alpha-tubulin suppressor-like RCC1 family protein
VPAITEERFSSVYAGGTVCHGQTCAITPDGDTWCWGRNYQSGLNGAGQFATVPTPLAGDPGLAEVAVGGYMVCGIGVDRALYCWGEGAYSRLGLGSGNSVFTPTAVLPEMSFSSVGPGNDHACAVAATGATYCWGRNNRGQLGSSSSQEGWSIPVAVWQD